MAITENWAILPPYGDYTIDLDTGEAAPSPTWPLPPANTQWIDWKIQDYATNDWPGDSYENRTWGEYEPIIPKYWIEGTTVAKLSADMDEFTIALKGAQKGMDELAKALESKTALWVEWLGEFLEVTGTTTGTDTIEITGLIRVPEDKKPDSDKAAVVYLTTRFLALMDKARTEKMPLTRLPEIVIGQVGTGYQAQVTLTMRSVLPTDF